MSQLGVSLTYYLIHERLNDVQFFEQEKLVLKGKVAQNNCQFHERFLSLVYTYNISRGLINQFKYDKVALVFSFESIIHSCIDLVNKFNIT